MLLGGVTASRHTLLNSSTLVSFSKQHHVRRSREEEMEGREGEEEEEEQQIGGGSGKWVGWGWTHP